jgi:hypothetical protein
MSWNDARRTFEEQIPGFRERKSQSDLAQTVEQAFTTGVPLLAQALPGPARATRRSSRCHGPGPSSPAGRRLLDRHQGAAGPVHRRLHRIKTNDPRVPVRGPQGPQQLPVPGRRWPRPTRCCWACPRPRRADPAAEKDEILGDVERLDFGLTPTQRRELTVTSEECPGKKCKFGSVCFAETGQGQGRDGPRHHRQPRAAGHRREHQGRTALPAADVPEPDRRRGARAARLRRGRAVHRDHPALASPAHHRGRELHRRADLVGAGELASGRCSAASRRYSGAKRHEAAHPGLVLELGSQLASLVEHLAPWRPRSRCARSSRRRRDDPQEPPAQALRQRRPTSCGRSSSTTSPDTVRWIERDEPNGGHSRGIMLCTAPAGRRAVPGQRLWSYHAGADVGHAGDHRLQDRPTDFGFMAKEQGLDLTGPYQTFVGPTPFDFETQARHLHPRAHAGLPAGHPGVVAFAVRLREPGADPGRRRPHACCCSPPGKRAERVPTLLAPRHPGQLGHRSSSRATWAPPGRWPTPSPTTSTRCCSDEVLLHRRQRRGRLAAVPGHRKLPFHYPDPLWQARMRRDRRPVQRPPSGPRAAFPTLQVPGHDHDPACRATAA